MPVKEILEWVLAYEIGPSMVFLVIFVAVFVVIFIIDVILDKNNKD